MSYTTLDPSVLLTSEGIVALITLTALEIVLGIDNIIVISILSGELKGKERQRKAQRLGLGLAMITRLMLLFSISFIMSMQDLDIVFSLDSVITAVGMSNQLVIMSLAVIIAVLMMLVASATIADFVNKHGTVKVLALAFLVMIGVALIMEGMGEHVNKAYIYMAMFFSVVVEFLNLRMHVNESRLMQDRDKDIHLD
ncbi:MAG: TerC family protein [Flavobacteriales bacterium]|nr:TerC family protein [Flavobacteriales bacterium]